MAKIMKKYSSNLDNYAKTMIGKTLIGLEFGTNDGEGSRIVTLGQVITGAGVGLDESREDVGTWITLENGEEVFAYIGEDIYLESV